MSGSCELTLFSVISEERFETSHLEPSIAEEPSTLEPPRLSVADSTLNQPTVEDLPPPVDNLDSTLVAPDNVSMPDPEMATPPMMSSDDEDNDDAFDEDLPSLPPASPESHKSVRHYNLAIIISSRRS